MRIPVAVPSGARLLTGGSGEEPDSPEHVLPRCLALMRVRFRLFGTLHPTLEDVRRDDAIVALVGVFRFFQSC